MQAVSIDAYYTEPTTGNNHTLSKVSFKLYSYVIEEKQAFL